MANCRGCGAYVDTFATVCPKCGRKDPTQSDVAKMNIGLITGLLSLAVIVIVIIATFS